MISRIRNLCLILTLIFASCEQSDEYIDSTSTRSDAVEMDFSFSIQSLIINDVEHVPMSHTRADNDDEVAISNWYRVLILKKIDSKWILDQILGNKLEPEKDNTGLYPASFATSLMNFTAILRPGEYQMTIFTGAKSMNWNNTQLVAGNILQDLNIEGSQPAYACTYRIIDGSYLNAGSRGLEEEIFSGTKRFIVEKTEDLHSKWKIVVFDSESEELEESEVENLHIPLERRVSKLRILLRNELDPGVTQTFFPDYESGNGISADIRIDGDQQFCYGLDIFGNPCYDANITIKNLKCGVFTWKGYQVGSDNKEHLVPMRTGSRQLSAFYFMEPGVDLSVIISDVSVTVEPTMPKFVYRQDVPPIVLKNNYITGIGFKPEGTTSYEQDEYGNNITCLGLKLITTDGINPEDLSGIFPYNHEYRPN